MENGQTLQTGMNQMARNFSYLMFQSNISYEKMEPNYQEDIFHGWRKRSYVPIVFHQRFKMNKKEARVKK
jgi:predicted RNA methylase